MKIATRLFVGRRALTFISDDSYFSVNQSFCERWLTLDVESINLLGSIEEFCILPNDFISRREIVDFLNIENYVFSTFVKEFNVNVSTLKSSYHRLHYLLVFQTIRNKNENNNSSRYAILASFGVKLLSWWSIVDVLSLIYQTELSFILSR